MPAGFGEPLPLKFQPRVVKDKTRRSAEFVYYDCDKIRFVNGLPQSMGGWIVNNSTAVQGCPRSLFAWSTLAGTNLLGIGTHLKYYVNNGGSIADVTPIRSSSTINADPFTTYNGETRVLVTDTGHGAIAGDFVTFSGATGPVGGISAATLNAEHQIATIIDSNSYEIYVSQTASSATSGGGASVVAAYQISVGLESTVIGDGWGAGTWGREGWGEAADVTVAGSRLRLWSEDNWGEDLLINPRGYPIYYYDSSAATRAVELSTMGGASDVPLFADQIITFPEQRQLIAFGVNEVGGTVADPMMVRWPATESVVDWTPTDTNDAGGFRLSIGSVYMCSVKIRQGLLSFTDTALYVIQFAGASGYVPRLVSDKISILGPRAANTLNGAGYWMSTRSFMSYTGTITVLPIEMSDYVFKNMNLSQRYKCHVSVHPAFNEVWFHYPSTNSDEIDTYVSFNVDDGTWAPGTFDRTASCPSGVFEYDKMADSSGYIYDHDYGASDLSTSTPASIGAYIETAIFPLGNPKYAHRVRSLWPDVSFMESTAASPSVDFSLRLQDKPGSEPRLEAVGSSVRTVSGTIEEFTDKLDVGKRGRYMSIRIEANDPGVVFRLGVPHLDAIQDGQR